jgi:hypothetical protein
MTVLRKAEDKEGLRWTKILDILKENNIIGSNFTGDLIITLNRGGVSGCKRVETLK